MNGYFSNPELKKSTVILLIVSAFFLSAILFIFNLFYINLKDDYIKSFGAIAGRVINKNPGLEKDIMPIITKGVSVQEGEKGKELLESYGLTNDLDNRLFPYLNKIILMNNISVFFVFILFITVLFILNYFQYGYIYKRIRKLTIGAKKVLVGEFDIIYSEYGEGDFSKLAVSFNSMRDAVRNNLSSLHKEKQFLVDLLSDISHQLKTPLSSLIIYNDLLLNKDLSDRQRRAFLINNQNQLAKMNWLIQSLLKLAKLDAGAIVFDKDKQSLNETVQEAIDALKRKAEDNKVKILFEDAEEIIFNHDKLWMEEAFINIIKNSIEHMPSGGGIIVKLTENAVFKRVIIEDNGEGISKDDLPHIFKRFYKAKTLKKTDSVGIGLSLTKSIIESHGGFIEVKSEVGTGTVFTVTFLKY